MTLRLANGSRHSRYLGKRGSAESRAAYSWLVAELAAAPTTTAIAAQPPAALSLDSILLAYDRWAEGHYRRPDGTPSSQLHNIRSTLEIVRGGYELSPASEFGPLAMKAVRVRMIAAGWSRGVINSRISLVKRILKWAASEELVPVAVYQALATVAGLQRGRTEARELPPVKPVEDSTVDATLPFLNRHVRGLVEFQRLTGSRSTEACTIRRCDIDTSGAVWLYTPAHHKTAHRGGTRVIALGPRAQELLREFFTTDLGDHLFSPRRSVEEFLADRAARRVTPHWPSHMDRNTSKRVRQPKRRATECYTRTSLGQAIDRACDRAFPLPAELAQRKREGRKKWWARLTSEERTAVPSSAGRCGALRLRSDPTAWRPNIVPKRMSRWRDVVYNARYPGLAFVQTHVEGFPRRSCERKTPAFATSPGRCPPGSPDNNIGPCSLTGRQTMPLCTGLKPSRPTTPWPPRSSEGPRRNPRRVDRLGRLWALGQILTFGVLIAVAAYWWASWVAGGWFAMAGWFMLISLMLVLVGWVMEHLGMRRIVQVLPERLTSRNIWPKP